jgi:DNA-binding transcriptional MocR family regulator
VNLNISISTGSSTPIYRQITDQVRHAVATGRLAVDEQLPSVRALAEELVLNPNTVFSREEGRRRLEPLIDALIGEAMAMDFTPGQLVETFESKMRDWKYEEWSSSKR